MAAPNVTSPDCATRTSCDSDEGAAFGNTVKVMKVITNQIGFTSEHPRMIPCTAVRPALPSEIVQPLVQPVGIT